jgi:pimeloyl-ACP methyl ester carboxylesterase
MDFSKGIIAMSKSLTVDVRGIRLGASMSGDPSLPGLLLLHGWPHSRALYEGVLEPLSADFFVLAFDLPDVGDSEGAPASAEKTVLADIALTAAESAGARNIVIAGLDVGGMIAFAAARDHGERISAAIVINTVIPGIDPWAQLMADPRIWHFAFHALPGLPETLVRGHERVYFDFFTDFLSGDPKRIPDALRAQFVRAYRRPDALKAGFDWYRAMAKDAEHNATATSIATPLLYVRGDADKRPIGPYLQGLEAAGAESLESRVVVGSGELLPIEAPQAFVDLVREFSQRGLTGQRGGRGLTGMA